MAGNEIPVWLLAASGKCIFQAGSKAVLDAGFEVREKIDLVTTGNSGNKWQHPGK